MIENAFGILKESFGELKFTSVMQVTILLDVECCCLLHNLLLGQFLKQVHNLLELLQREGMVAHVNDDANVEPSSVGHPNDDFKRGEAKRCALGLYLPR